MVKINVSKVEKIFEISKSFGLKINLSRKKFIISFIMAMCLSRSVKFEEIGLHLNEDATTKSNIRRIHNHSAA
jgi:hypothetical protein